MTASLVCDVVAGELARIERAGLGNRAAGSGRHRDAAALFTRIALDLEPVEFLTLPAVDLID